MAEDTSPTTGNAQTANANHAATPRDAAPAHVALIGRSGSGKTAVARAAIGTEREPAAQGAYARYQDSAAPVIVDDVAGWVNGSESTLGAIFSYLEAARSADLPLGAIWYTLDASTARVTEYELRLIQRLTRMYPVVVVLTRADLVAEDAVAAMRAAIEGAEIPNVLGVIAVAADPLPALGIAPYGVDEVLALTPRHARAQRPTGAAPTQPQPAASRPATPQRAQAAPRATYAGSGRGGRRASRPYGAAELDSQISRTLLVALILIPMAVALTLALIFFGRRRAAAEAEEE